MNVAITGLHAVENPSPGFGVARCLRQSDRKVVLIGYAYHPLYTAAFDDIWDEVRLIPDPSALLRDVESGTVEAIIPTIDYEVEILASKLASRAEALGLPVLDAVRQVAKANLSALAESIGLAVPETMIASSLEEADSFLVGLGGPGVVKGLVYGAARANTPSEGAQLARKVLRAGNKVIVQRWIDGDESGIAGVAWQGHLLGLVGMRKLGVTEGGTTWCGVSIETDDLIANATAFCKATNWTGGFEIEVVREKTTGIRYLIEINTRFPSWILLGAGAGANLPALLLDAVAGRDLTDCPARATPGMVFARAAVDIVRPLGSLATFILEGHRP